MTDRKHKLTLHSEGKEQNEDICLALNLTHRPSDY
jgi:hypothetical protein